MSEREELGAEIYDELHYPDGRVERREPFHNTIQILPFGALKAKLLTGKDSAPWRYLELGTGDPAWDASPPPPTASATESALLAPLARSNLLIGADWTYLAVPPTSPETVSGAPTGRVRLSVTFGIGIANGNLREVALYGGAAASGTLSTGDITSVIRHTVIQKPAGGSDFALVRILILQL